MDWDSKFNADADGQTMLPEGNYQFTVVGFTRGRYNGGDKMPPCPQAEVKVRIDDCTGGTLTLTENLKLHESCEWVLCAFWKCVGQQPDDSGKIAPDWANIIGKCGTVAVTHRKFGDKTFHNLRFLPPEDCSTATAATKPAWTGSF